MCGNEEITLKDSKAEIKGAYNVGEDIPNLWEIDFREYFKSNDSDCPPYNF